MATRKLNTLTPSYALAHIFAYSMYRSKQRSTELPNPCLTDQNRQPYHYHKRMKVNTANLTTTTDSHTNGMGGWARVQKQNLKEEKKKEITNTFSTQLKWNWKRKVDTPSEQLRRWVNLKNTTKYKFDLFILSEMKRQVYDVHCAHGGEAREREWERVKSADRWWVSFRRY